ncbi:phage integrase N-terminal SAM-like domain-containing protein [Roseiflexus sp.]|uniref:phage integrase N-terminal SAM-like domain-containing protein n=1 Tax=Roseiflexus sp. TaxID=2562120 RepID=UPI00398A6DDC
MSESSHPPKRLDQVRAALRRKPAARRTEDADVGWIRRLIHVQGIRHPRLLGAAEVSAFLAYLAVEREVAASTQNQALSALLFLYRDVLLQPLSEDLTITDAKRPTYPPTVLSREEAQAVLAALSGVHHLMASLCMVVACACLRADACACKILIAISAG